MSAPRQNRVDPFGRLIADSARGELMGNRGCLHDEQGRIRRFHRGKRWIYCRLEFKGRKRRLMQPNRYTELFFVDEATALAAGHRPCAECMRERFNEFRARWAVANAGAVEAPVMAGELDAVLQSERIDRAGGKATFEAALTDLPDGPIVLLPSSNDGAPQPHLVAGERVWAWTPSGYERGHRARAGTVVEVLTPRSTVRAFAEGFQAHVRADRDRRQGP